MDDYVKYDSFDYSENVTIMKRAFLLLRKAKNMGDHSFF